MVWQLSLNIKLLQDSNKNAFCNTGCLPYLVGKCNLNCPIYSTTPVCKMGEMFMYDLHQSKHNYEDFTLFTLDDIDLAFERIVQLKYNQSLELKGKGHGIVITPLPSGHMIGGTIWKIIKDNEEDIIYAVDYNHKKERHLNGCNVDNISRPSLLITNCYNALYKQERRTERDAQLMANIVSAIRNGGNVLVAVDTAGRVLELSHMLDQMWRQETTGLSTYSLAMLNTVSYNVIEFAKSQVEWMSDNIMKTFEGQRNNPFSFKQLKLLHNISELEKLREPVVVLASQPDLESGFARELFIRWSSNPRNCIILTQRSSSYTLASKLINLLNIRPGSARTENAMEVDKQIVTIEVKSRVPLEGEELFEYNENLRIQMLEELKNKMKDSSFDTDDEDENDVGNLKDLDKPNQQQAEDSFFKQNLLEKKNYPIYPLFESKMKWDEYGEVVNPKDFLVFDKSEMMITELNSEATRQVEEIDEMIKEVPTKCVRERKSFIVNASIQFIDFEGRSDGESIKKIIERIKPRRLILVRGDEKATELMRDYSMGSLGLDSTKLFTPRRNEIVDATTERNIYQVKLKDSLVSSLKFAKARDGAELCWIEAAIQLKEDEMNNLEAEADNSKVITLKQIAGTRDSPVPMLRPLEPDELSNHVTIFVNELKLSDFKQVLVKHGIQAEFHSGVLYVCDKVCVRRNEAGRINLEGTICEDYFKVRKLLYDQYAII